MTTTRESTAANLLPQVIRFTGSTGAGQWAFHLLCATPACRRIGKISTSRAGIKGQRNLERAAGKFAAQGWLIDSAPVCPHCAKSGAKPREAV